LEMDYVRDNIMNIGNFLDFCDLYGINPCFNVGNDYSGKCKKREYVNN